MIDKNSENNENNENNGNSVEEVKKKQGRNLAIIVGAIACIFIFFYFLVSDKPKPEAKDQAAEFASPIKHIDAGSILIEKTETRLATAEKNTEDLKKEVAELTKEKVTQEEQKPKADEEIKTLTNRITDLEKKLSNPSIMSNIATANGMPTDQNYTGSIFPPISAASDGSNGQGISNSSQPLMMQGIRDDAITLTASTGSIDFLNVPSKTPDTYVPPGTFVKAVAIGGADASAAVNAQSNPTPMLFRIIEDGTMPNKQKSHLNGCLATAAVVGDISSERGLVRLETLSCVDPDTKRITDLAVEGTVFGPEGKNGVRGIPMWREGVLLQRAFAAGTLSGLASGISQKYTTTSTSPLGATQTINGSDIFKYGAATGLSNAMEKLADYNIQRAEQYHPVLQLSAGTVVDLVFLKGFYLDGLKHDESGQSTSTNIAQISTSTSDMTKLPLTAEQIERLKTHMAQLKG